MTGKGLKTFGKARGKKQKTAFLSIAKAFLQNGKIADKCYKHKQISGFISALQIV